MDNQPTGSANRRFPFDPKEKVSIFIGAYGSGKSEIAVNFAILLADRIHRACEDLTEKSSNEFFENEYRQIVLADLDIINPFFRSADAAKVLESKRVSLISPQYANTNVDVPAVPQAVYSVFDQKGIRAVLDIGGEDMGARVVSSLKSRIIAVSYAVYMVVNLKRPFTDTKEKIIRMMRELEDAAGLRVGGLINNTNLLEATDQRELLEANGILREVEKDTGVPLCFAAGMDADYPSEWGGSMPDHTPFLRLTRTISYEEPVL